MPLSLASLPRFDAGRRGRNRRHDWPRARRRHFLERARGRRLLHGRGRLLLFVSRIGGLVVTPPQALAHRGVLLYAGRLLGTDAHPLWRERRSRPPTRGRLPGMHRRKPWKRPLAYQPAGSGKTTGRRGSGGRAACPSPYPVRGSIAQPIGGSTGPRVDSADSLKCQPPFKGASVKLRALSGNFDLCPRGSPRRRVGRDDLDGRNRDDTLDFRGRAVAPSA
jgi:hypothetical protein